ENVIQGYRRKFHFVFHPRRTRPTAYRVDVFERIGLVAGLQRCFSSNETGLRQTEYKQVPGSFVITIRQTGFKKLPQWWKLVKLFSIHIIFIVIHHDVVGGIYFILIPGLIPSGEVQYGVPGGYIPLVYGGVEHA